VAFANAHELSGRQVLFQAVRYELVVLPPTVTMNGVVARLAVHNVFYLNAVYTDQVINVSRWTSVTLIGRVFVKTKAIVRVTTTNRIAQSFLILT
jgi:hypothetical protein